MSDKMTPIPFGEMLINVLKEYENYGTILGVKPQKTRPMYPIGPAAGPHTQLCGNLVAAYVAGAACFELKTVQILTGEELGIQKPCIYVGNEVYNTEWSTELTVEEAFIEYCKAFVMIQVLSVELGFLDAHKLEYIMSVGYDYAGITSPVMDTFLEQMKNPSQTKVWKEQIQWLKDQLHQFKQLTLKEVKEIEENKSFCNQVTLSTMHGCPKEEIAKIGSYLLKEKKLDTWIKMNPTLVGKEKAKEILNQKGYAAIPLEVTEFEGDLTLKDAMDVIAKCEVAASLANKRFGIKMTNTFPVPIRKGELNGKTMYLSGPALYGLSVTAAALLRTTWNKTLNISYSGGCDSTNVADLILTGMKPITVSSVLLKPGGYEHIHRLIKEIDRLEGIPKEIDVYHLNLVANKASTHQGTNQKKTIVFEKKPDYSLFCSRCHNCESVCPNRANIRIHLNGRSIVIHRDRLCNACGCCSYSCIVGHQPYLEKFTVFEEREAFERANIASVLLENNQVVLDKGLTNEEKEQVRGLINEAIKTGKL